MTEEKKSTEQINNKAENNIPEQTVVQNRKGFIEMEGEVVEMLPAGSFKVKFENGHEILAHLSGKMRMYKIRLVLGDKVKIEMSPYDMTKGRIIRRF